MIRMYKYSGNGRTFLAIDGRDAEIPRFRNRKSIHALCLIHDTDGILILDKSEKADFRLECYNADGNDDQMDDDGCRCIVAFADLLGVKPFHTKDYTFEAKDGLHTAAILSHLGECKIIRLNDGSESSQTGPALCEGELE